MAEALNYAEQYSQALANAYPYALRFGALYSTANNQRYRVTGAKTIEIPKLSTTGRVDGDRDGISEKKRNFSNEWEPKVLTNHRKWDTLVHPLDIDQTNYVASIQNITQVFNVEQKFPEMDRYCISKIYSDWEALGNTAKSDVLTVENVLSLIDSMMEDMNEANVPEVGRILYTTPAVKTLIKNAKDMVRTLDLKNGQTQLTREVTRLDEVSIEKIPSNIMKTAFDFTIGSEPAPEAKDIKMALIHPSSVLTPVTYSFAQLSPPAAMSDGKWVYYEEAFEDVFILNAKASAIDFVIGG